MTVMEKVKEIIVKKTAIDINIIKPESTFKDLKVDSLYLVEIMMALEDEFEIVLDDDDVVITTVQEAVDYVSSKLA